MKNVEALKAVYVAIGGSLDDVANISTNVGVLNKISVKLGGSGTATDNATAINNIASVVASALKKPEQTKTVALSMASGNQSVTPDSGKVLTSVTIEKPETLIAENIKKDVVIGGVTGSYEG